MSWFWKGDDGWVEYKEEDAKKLEQGHKKGQKAVKLNDTYKVDLKEMMQFRIDDPDKQREIKREEDEGKGKKRAKEAEDEEVPKKKSKGKEEKGGGGGGVGSKRLQHDLKIIKEAEAKGDLGMSVELLDDDMYRWEIKLSEFDKNSQLAKDLVQYNQKHGIDYITMRFYFPDDYPLTAPMVHIVSPRLTGPYIFSGGLCMNILMQGWAPGIVPESLVLQIRQLFMEGNIRIQNINKKEFYSEQEARQGFHTAQNAHKNDKNFAE
jgi:ubiquitin-protein ligase